MPAPSGQAVRRVVGLPASPRRFASSRRGAGSIRNCTSAPARNSVVSGYYHLPPTNCMFGALHAVDDSSIAALIDIARDFTPRFEVCDSHCVVLDLAGLTRLFGHPRAIG